ncbi:hypothetical protein Btru_052708 [Bulinus truncatus]|nr:hypothetical protein Btru_052708 [Bulinus truncatus]
MKEVIPRSTFGTNGSIPWAWLNEEKWRLHTFAKYPHKAAKSAILLAAYGFAYIGSGKGSDDSVVCFFCGTKKRDWVQQDVIKQVHEQLSPSCSMVTGVSCSNVPMKVPTNCFDLFTRTYSKNRAPKPIIQSGDFIESDSVIDNTQHAVESVEVNTLSSEGYSQISYSHGYQPGDNDAPSATVTSADTPSWLPYETDQFRSAHERSARTTQRSAIDNSSAAQTAIAPVVTSSNMSASQQLANTSNSSASNASNHQPSPHVPLPLHQPPINTNHEAPCQSRSGPSYSELGIITERPKRFEYALKIKRVQTYSSWPRGHNLKPEELADAGFYYAGYGDCARCFYCGGGLRNWEDEDNVWVEHARWFPKCAYIRQLMGHVFVDTVQNLNKTHDKISLEMVASELNSFNLDFNDTPLKRDPAIKTAVTMGFTLTDVLTIADLLKENGTQLSADKVLEKLWEEGKRSNQSTVADVEEMNSEVDVNKSLELITTLKDRNNLLRQQTVCKICMDKEVAVVFLPCGHLISCTDCAAAMKDCPVCRIHVKGTVRAFLG